MTEQPTRWTMDTFAAHIQRQIDDLRRMLDERYATQTKAVDAAFVAQQTAMQTALESAEKAVDKAGMASEKRFESVNEFRGQLSDQAASFITRAEGQTLAVIGALIAAISVAVALILGLNN